MKYSSVLFIATAAVFLGAVLWPSKDLTLTNKEPPIEIEFKDNNGTLLDVGSISIDYGIPWELLVTGVVKPEYIGDEVFAYWGVIHYTDKKEGALEFEVGLRSDGLVVWRKLP